MSRAKDLNCRCRYKLPEAALRIPLLNVTGKHGPEAMLFAPICTRSQAPFRMRPPLDMGGDPDEGDPEYGEVWRLEADDSLIFVEGDPARTFTVKTTVTSFAPGGIVTELRYTDVDGLIARYENDYAYVPHRGCTMRLVDYDPTGGNDRAVDWMDYCCLRPAMQVEVGDCAECDDVDGLTVADYAFLFVVEPGNYEHVVPADVDPEHEEEEQALACDCEHVSRSMAGVGGGLICSYGETRTECDEVFGYSSVVAVELRAVSPTSSEIRYYVDNTDTSVNHFSAFPDRSACDIARFGGEFDLTWVGVDPFGCDGDAPVHVTIIPLTANGEVRTSGVPCGPKYCGGVSGWNLVEKCRANDTAVYEWLKVTEAACKGECSDDGCRATQPFQLQGALSLDGESERLTDDDAMDLGYRALVEGVITVDGGCDCNPAPTTPSCETGCSVWRLDRELCEVTGPGKYLYFWTFQNSSCPGTCVDGSCAPEIPETPTLPSSAISDADAIAWVDGDLTAMVGDDFVGGCACDATYTRPECTCACTDLTGAATFTITGAGFPHDGPYTLTKGTCNFVVSGIESTPCCWRGTNVDDGEIFAELWYDPIQQRWYMQFDNGPFYQSAVTEPCLSPFSMSLVSGGAGIYPTSISVSI